MRKTINSEDEIQVDIHSKIIILCDMDGTLIDTDYANYLSYKCAIEMVTCQRREIQFNSGRRIDRKRLKEIIPSLTDNQCKKIVSLKAEYYRKHLPETKVNIALANFIRKHSRTNQTVLVTCCREARAVETLQYHNLLDCFSRLVYWEDLSRSGLSNKYVNALNLLGANPVNCIVFENERIEIEKAMLAGVPRENVNYIRSYG